MNLLNQEKYPRLFAIIQLLFVYGLILNPWTSFPYTFIVIVITIILITYWNDKTLSTIGLKYKYSFLKIIGVALLLFLLVEPILDFIIQPLVNKITGEIVDYSAFQSLENNHPKYLKYFFFTLISAGFGEEILFRGFLFRQFKIILPKFKLKALVILLLSALLFSLPHLYQGLSGLIMTFIFGVIFGIIYIKTNYNLWIPIVFHCLVDTMFLTLAYFGKLYYYILSNDLFFGY